ncbi:MAG: dipeptidase PepE [Bacteroidetes bacterium]|nr:dipeptidase PepE [Bacteroidota bacterium]
MRLLLLSNSTLYGQPYLDWPKKEIRKYLRDDPIEVLFIPYAGIMVGYDSYTEMVAGPFNRLGYSIRPIHLETDPLEAVNNAAAIAIGGGNTFHLLYSLYENNLVQALREKVENGTPFIGWSAGSNMACPTIRTTNDMPIIEPKSFDALNLVPFQINPHYLDLKLEGHAGETREQRLEEFLEVNQDIYCVGLREGTALRREGSKLTLLGDRKMRLFRYGAEPMEYTRLDNLDFLLASH